MTVLRRVRRQRALIVLRQAATMPAQAGYSGLYHLAINLPTSRRSRRRLPG
jgi:catechol-2,3-dioxygenase